MNDENWKIAFRILEQAEDLPVADRLNFLLSATDDPAIAALLLKLHEEDSAADGERVVREVPEPKAGDQIGRYNVLRRLGKGGMGSVYQARDNELNRLVALKFLSRPGSSQATDLEGLLREARAASALNHPHIVTIYEVVRSGEWTAISMEYIEGTSLRELCQGGSLPVDKVIRYGVEIITALATTHRKGIVHRDIKPENIMVQVDGRIKVVDFGTAHTIEVDGGMSDPRAGTVRYFSPEQARGDIATPASDIFSLGVVLYEISTGGHPFAEETHLATLQAIAHRDAVPPLTHNRDIPKGLNKLILDMLRRPAHLRPAADDLHQRLVRLSNGSVRRFRPLVRWSLIGVFILIALILWTADRSDMRPPLRELTTTDTENHVTTVAISPDGSKMAYAEISGALLIRSIEDGQTHTLPGAEFSSVEQLQWFPDGSALLAGAHTSATGEHGSVWKVPLDGKEPELVVEAGDSVALSADGALVAFTKERSSEIWIADVKHNAVPRRLLSGGQRDVFPLLFWAPDSKRLFFQRRRSLNPAGLQSVAPNFEITFKRTLEVMDISSGKLLYSRDISMYSAVAQKDGRLWFLWPTAAHSLNLWEMRVDPATAQITRSPKLVTDYKQTALAGLSASRDGQRLAMVRYQYQADVYTAQFDPNSLKLLDRRRLTLDRAADYPHSFSPKGDMVFFESDRNGSFDIFRQSLREKHASFITGDPARDEYNPIVTPHGKWLLFGSAGVGDGKDRRLERIPLNGGQPVRVPIGGPLDYFGCALPGGKRCVLRTTQNKQFVFYELDPINGRGKELARVPASAAIMGDWSLSGDGSEVAIPNHDERDPLIRVVSLEDSANAPQVIHLRSPGMINGVVHSANNDGWFVALRGDNELYRTSPWLRVDLVFVNRKGEVKPLRDIPIASWAVPAPGGRRIAFLDGAITANAVLLER